VKAVGREASVAVSSLAKGLPRCRKRPTSLSAAKSMANATSPTEAAPPPSH